MSARYQFIPWVRAGAATELKTAITLCESDNDQPCAAEARRLLR